MTPAGTDIWTSGQRVARLLGAVAVVDVVVPTVFADFDEYWRPFLSAHAPAPSFVDSLGKGFRAKLREALPERLPTGDDGSISLTARAWAVRGNDHGPGPGVAAAARPGS